MPILETSTISNEGDCKMVLNNNLKNVCPENTSFTKINSSASSKISVKLDSSKINENSCNQIENHLKNEDHIAVKSNGGKKKAASEISKDRKTKCGAPFTNKPSYHNKHLKHPLSKRKFVPVASHLTNASTKVVLFERNVEIKDLESKVKYLQNKIKELENENKTLQSVQSRQERELKKFKEGVADIPSLLRSHKEENKVYESALSNVRRELRDSQRDVKAKNEVLLKKESQIDKLNVTTKRYEKNIQDLSNELKEFKSTKKDLEEEIKILLGNNESLKSENENLQKKIKSMVQEIENLEENFMKEKILNKRHKDDLMLLQKKYEDLQLKLSLKKDNVQSELILNSNSEKEELCEKSTEIVSEDNIKSKDSKSCDLLSNEPFDDLPVHPIEDKSPLKEPCIDKTKVALIHTLKRYQDLCNTKSSIPATKTCGIGANNMKMLPPLKQTSGKYSRSKQSDFTDKECFSLSVEAASEKNENKQWQSKELAKYFHTKLKTNVNTKIESKIFVTKDDKNCLLKPNSSQSYMQEVSTLDSW